MWSLVKMLGVDVAEGLSLGTTAWKWSKSEIKAAVLGIPHLDTAFYLVGLWFLATWGSMGVSLRLAMRADPVEERIDTLNGQLVRARQAEAASNTRFQALAHILVQARQAEDRRNQELEARMVAFIEHLVATRDSDGVRRAQFRVMMSRANNQLEARMGALRALMVQHQGHWDRLQGRVEDFTNVMGHARVRENDRYNQLVGRIAEVSGYIVRAQEAEQTRTIASIILSLMLFRAMT